MSDEPLKPAAPLPPQAPAAPVVPSTSKPLTPDDINLIIDKWMNEKIHGSIIGRDTLVWNEMYKAVKDLKSRLGVK